MTISVADHDPLSRGGPVLSHDLPPTALTPEQRETRLAVDALFRVKTKKQKKTSSKAA